MRLCGGQRMPSRVTRQNEKCWRAKRKGTGWCLGVVPVRSIENSGRRRARMPSNHSPCSSCLGGQTHLTRRGQTSPRTVVDRLYPKTPHPRQAIMVCSGTPCPTEPSPLPGIDKPLMRVADSRLTHCLGCCRRGAGFTPRQSR